MLAKFPKSNLQSERSHLTAIISAYEQLISHYTIMMNEAIKRRDEIDKENDNEPDYQNINPEERDEFLRRESYIFEER